MPEGILERVRRLWRPSRPATPATPHTAAASVGDACSVRCQCRTASAAAKGDLLLRVQGLSKSFKGVRALAGVDVDVRRGEILGLLGPNGSGKSTFINVVSGHYTPSGGEIVFEGRCLNGLPAHRIAGSGIARTYQIPRPFAHLSVLRTSRLPRCSAARSATRAPRAGRR